MVEPLGDLLDLTQAADESPAVSSAECEPVVYQEDVGRSFTCFFHIRIPGEKRCCEAPSKFFTKRMAKQNISRHPCTTYYVYILRSICRPKRLYIGCTENIEKRLIEHSRGNGTYSKTYAPWELEVYMAFKSREVAEGFERYLKSGSGFAFLKKRLLPKL